MSQTKDVVPGYPALHPTYTPKATASGALDVEGSSISGANKVTPLKTFHYALPGGGVTTFYKSMPRVVSASVKAALLAEGLVS